MQVIKIKSLFIVKVIQLKNHVLVYFLAIYYSLSIPHLVSSFICTDMHAKNYPNNYTLDSVIII